MTLRRLSPALVIATTAFSTVGCDQVTKHLARTSAPQGQSLLGGVVEFQLTLNPGGFLSFGTSLAPATRAAVFIVASLAFVSGLAVVLWRRRHLPLRISAVALALLAAGGLGNLIDRVCQRGLVTDFCVLRLGSLHTGVFNVADVALTLGAVLLVTCKEHERTATA